MHILQFNQSTKSAPKQQKAAFSIVVVWNQRPAYPAFE